MEEATLYRIENEKGMGPYVTYYNILPPEYYYHEDRPSPYKDQILVEKYGMGTKCQSNEFRYAFGSMDQLEKWFDLEVRKSLSALGFRIAKFVAVGGVGETQAVYLKDTRKDVAFIKLTEKSEENG